MTREEAIRRIKAWNLDSDGRDVLAVVIPEFHESEDERIRKVIVKYFKELHEQSWINLEIPDILAWLERQKEEDEEDNDFTIYHPLKNGKGEYECIPYSFYGSLTSFSEDKDLIDFLRTCFYTEEECNKWIEQQKEQKPADLPAGFYFIDQDGNKYYSKEFRYNNGTFTTTMKVKEEQKPSWSEKDEKMLQSIIKDFRDGNISSIGQEQWLKSLPEKFSLQPKQEWSKEDEMYLSQAIETLEHENYLILADKLKSLRPRLSDEEIKKIRSEEYTNGFNDCLLGKQKGWSKGDEEMLDSIIKVVCGVGSQPNGLREKQVRFLESLRPSWKPSKDLEEAVEELFETIEIQEHENIFEDTFKKIFIAGVEWQKQQKLLEWSDNFEENIQKLLHDKLTWHSEDGSISSTVFINDKTLKDIINGIWFYVGKEALKYPNKELNVEEWSEEDEKLFWGLTAYIPNEELERLGVTRDDILKKIKSLRPHWKPSKEQMEALDKAIPVCMGVVGRDEIAPLESLCEELKKL